VTPLLSASGFTIPDEPLKS